jgi:peptidoglycan L-alanyl-D-glutamate endopeptidase CwlK
MAFRRPLKNDELTSEIIRRAQQILFDLFPKSLGAEIEFTSAGKHYVGVLERHYHPPGGLAKPWGPHKGVTVYAIEEMPSGSVTETQKSPYFLGKNSVAKLVGVHADLVRVIQRAIEITPVDFTVIEGLRTAARQKQLVAQGQSQTMNSRHLTGHAVDIAPFVNGTVRWDWPLFRQIAPAVMTAADELTVAVNWGGNWASFPDGPHFELDRRIYP